MAGKLDWSASWFLFTLIREDPQSDITHCAENLMALLHGLLPQTLALRHTGFHTPSHQRLGYGAANARQPIVCAEMGEHHDNEKGCRAGRKDLSIAEPHVEGFSVIDDFTRLKRTIFDLDSQEKGTGMDTCRWH